MLAFGSAAGANGGILSNPLISILMIVLAVFVFLKFCGWAKNFQLSGGLKKTVLILTGVGVIVFNLMYNLGNAAVKAGEGAGLATIALVAALVWVFIFAFTLMAETK